MTARSKENGREIFYDKVLNCWRYEDTHEIVQNLDKNEESKEDFANVIRPVIPLGKWYCPECNKLIDGQDVTFEETHDVRSGGCGCKVE